MQNVSSCCGSPIMHYSASLVFDELLLTCSTCSRFWHAPSAVKSLLHGLAMLDIVCLAMSFSTWNEAALYFDGASLRMSSFTISVNVAPDMDELTPLLLSLSARRRNRSAVFDRASALPLPPVTSGPRPNFTSSVPSHWTTRRQSWHPKVGARRQTAKRGCASGRSIISPDLWASSRNHPLTMRQVVLSETDESSENGFQLAQLGCFIGEMDAPCLQV